MSNRAASTFDDVKPEFSTQSSTCPASSMLKSPSQGRCVRHGLDRDQLGADGSRKPLDDILPAGYPFGALLDQRVRSAAGRLSYEAGPNTSRPNSMAIRVVVREPEYCAPWGDHNPERHPRYDPVGAALLGLPENLLVLLRVDDVNASTRDAYRRDSSSASAPFISLRVISRASPLEITRPRSARSFQRRRGI
jgi:hypothetical protein